MSVEAAKGRDGRVRRAKDGTIIYRVRWREGGRERSRIVGKKQLADAFDAKVTLNKRVGGVGLIAAVEQTFAELANDWWELYALPNLKQNTLDQHAMLLDNYILPRIGGLRLREITPETIAGLRVDLERANRVLRTARGERRVRVGQWSVGRSLMTVNAVFDRAVQWGRMATNPAAGVAKPSTRRRRKPQIVAPETVEAIRDTFIGKGRVRDATIVSILAYAGLRPFEALALPVAAVGKKTLALEKAKLERARSVTLFGPLRQDLAEYLMAAGRPRPDDLLFPDANGNVWPKDTWDNWRDRVYRPVAAACGVPAGHVPYDLRHSFVSLLIHEGRSVADVAEQAGHSPAVCLSTYLHAFREFDPADRVSAEERIVRARQRARERGHRHATDAGPT
jgi:integrase